MQNGIKVGKFYFPTFFHTFGDPVISNFISYFFDSEEGQKDADN
jgi:hypothetical protein